MYCKNCGKQIADDSSICPYCNSRTSFSAPSPSKPDDAPSFGWAVLGFLFPLIGLILYLVWKSDYPQKAHSVGKGALIGVIISVVVSLISIIIISCTTCALLNSVAGY